MLGSTPPPGPLPKVSVYATRGFREGARMLNVTLGSETPPT